MSGAITVEASAERISVTSASGDDARTISPDHVNLTDVSRKLAEALTGLPGSGTRAVDVVITPPLVQLRTLHGLPPLKPADLSDLLKENQTRFFRRTATPTVVGVVPIGTPETGGRARAALAELPLLEALEAGVSSAGFRVRRMCAVDDTVPGGVPLPTPTLCQRARRRSVRTAVMMTFVALAGWCTAGMTYIVDLVGDNQRVALELAELADPLSRMQRLEEQIASFAPVTYAVRRQSPDSGSVVPRLVGLAISLPMDAHVHSVVTERAGDMAIEVHGADPPSVVDALADWWPGRVRITQPPRRDADRNLELFTVTLESAR